MSGATGNASCLARATGGGGGWLALAELAVLVPLTLLTVLGNGLVVAAVVRCRALRSAAGLLIASLAVADLSVGALVLPFSAANQVLGRWVFGVVWCHVWLAIDVWMCTASIYNLVAIAVDRYLAITKPLSYRCARSCSNFSKTSFMWSFHYIFYTRTNRKNKANSLEEIFSCFVQNTSFLNQ